MRALALILTLWAGQAEACKLALMLGIDVSHSIDTFEYQMQVDGLHKALKDPVIAEILIRDQVALAVMQWSGAAEQDLSLPWFRILSSEHLGQFTARVSNLTRPFSKSNTAVGNAIDAMVFQFSKVSDCQRRVIDFSGDGVSNAGPLPIDARGRAAAAEIMINGLAIDRVGRSVTEYFKRHVTVGRGSFVLTATGYRDYARAIKKKLLRELLQPLS